MTLPIRNVTTVNEALIHEVAPIVFLKMRRSYLMASILFFGLGIAYSINTVFMGLFVSGLAVVLAAFLFFLYRKNMKKYEADTIASIRQNYGTASVETEVLIDEEQLTARAMGNEKVHPLKEIERVDETARYFILTFKGRLLFHIDKQGFIEGTADDLRELLTKKGISFGKMHA